MEHEKFTNKNYINRLKEYADLEQNNWNYEFLTELITFLEEKENNEQ